MKPKVKKHVELLMYCGRTEKSLQTMLETIAKEHANDSDLHALLSQSAMQSYKSQPFRGYTLLNHDGETATDIQVLVKSLFLPVVNAVLFRISV